MTRSLLMIMALLIAGSAHGAGLGGKRTRVSTTARTAAQSPVVAEYRATGCGGQFAAVRGQPVTCSRVNTGWYECGAGPVAAPANTCRVEADGLLSESYSAQYMLNNCTAPASQSATLGTGNFTAWMEGAGSMVVAAGTAVASGLPCTATEGTDCSFTVTTGGTVSVTLDGVVTFAQLQNYLERTSKICCGGGACNRQTDLNSIPMPSAIAANEWTLLATIKPRVSWAAAAGQVWGWGANAAANSARTKIGPTNVDATVLGLEWYMFTTNAVTYRYAAVPLDVTVGHSLAYHFKAGVPSMWADGVELPVHYYATNSSTGIAATLPATLDIASGASGQLRGWVSDFKVCRGSPSQCGYAAASVTKVACLGDSITKGSALITYPQRLYAALGAGWGVGQFGVGGDRTDQIIARWRSDVSGRGYSWLALIGGVNDLMADRTAVATYANLTAIITEAKAAGMSVVLGTVLPFGNFTDWSAARQVELEALNALIAGTPDVTVIDTYAAFGEPGTPEDLAAVYDGGDHLHPNQAGRDLLAALVKAAIAP